MMNRSECIAEYGSDYQIQKMINEGLLYQVGKAIYSKEKNVPYIAVLSYRYPNAVVTMHSAFYLYGFTDVVPDDYDLATNRDSAKIRDKSVKQYFVREGFFELGVERIEYKGYEVQIYSKERLLIELLRYKSKLPFDYYKEILLNYRKIMPKLNIQEIQDYALESPKNNKILETLQMEVL